MDNFSARFPEKLFGKFIRIRMGHIDGSDFGVDDQTGANAAGLMGAIEHRVSGAGAIETSLDDGVLLRVHTPAEFMVLSGGHILLFPQATHIGAMSYTFGTAVVAAGEYLVVFHEDSAYLAAQTSAASGGQKGHFHEVLLPTGACFH